jgi:hypothetical protein
MPLRVVHWVLKRPNGMFGVSLLLVFAVLLGMFCVLENPCVVVDLFVCAIFLAILRMVKKILPLFHVP